MAGDYLEKCPYCERPGMYPFPSSATARMCQQCGYIENKNTEKETEKATKQNTRKYKLEDKCGQFAGNLYIDNGKIEFDTDNDNDIAVYDSPRVHLCLDGLTLVDITAEEELYEKDTSQKEDKKMLKCRWIENGQTMEGLVHSFVVNNENYVFAIVLSIDNKVRTIPTDPKGPERLEVFPPTKKK